jgi:hypothetical protein
MGTSLSPGVARFADASIIPDMVSKFIMKKLMAITPSDQGGRSGHRILSSYIYLAIYSI